MQMKLSRATKAELLQIRDQEECDKQWKDAADIELKRRQRNRENSRVITMNEIYESLDWNLYDHLRQADSIVRTMISEMGLYDVPAKLAVPFLQEKLGEIVKRISKESSESEEEVG